MIQLTSFVTILLCASMSLSAINVFSIRSKFWYIWLFAQTSRRIAQSHVLVSFSKQDHFVEIRLDFRAIALSPNSTHINSQENILLFVQLWCHDDSSAKLLRNSLYSCKVSWKFHWSLFDEYLMTDSKWNEILFYL